MASARGGGSRDALRAADAGKANEIYITPEAEAEAAVRPRCAEEKCARRRRGGTAQEGRRRRRRRRSRRRRRRRRRMAAAKEEKEKEEEKEEKEEEEKKGGAGRGGCPRRRREGRACGAAGGATDPPTRGGGRSGRRRTSRRMPKPGGRRAEPKLRGRRSVRRARPHRRSESTRRGRFRSTLGGVRAAPPPPPRPRSPLRRPRLPGRPLRGGLAARLHAGAPRAPAARASVAERLGDAAVDVFIRLGDGDERRGGAADPREPGRWPRSALELREAATFARHDREVDRWARVRRGGRPPRRRRRQKGSGEKASGLA